MSFDPSKLSEALANLTAAVQQEKETLDSLIEPVRSQLIAGLNGEETVLLMLEKKMNTRESNENLNEALQECLTQVRELRESTAHFDPRSEDDSFQASRITVDFFARIMEQFIDITKFRAKLVQGVEKLPQKEQPAAESRSSSTCLIM